MISVLFFSPPSLCLHLLSSIHLFFFIYFHRLISSDFISCFFFFLKLRCRKTRIAVCIDLWWATILDFLKEIPKQRTEKKPESERLSFCTATLFLYSRARIREGLFSKIRIAAITGLPVFIVRLLVHRRRRRRETSLP